MSRLSSLLVAALVLGSTAAQAAPLVNVDRHGVALDGYDAVAFFTDHRPVKGNASFQSSQEGATYYFASAEHQRAFGPDDRQVHGLVLRQLQQRVEVGGVDGDVAALGLARGAGVAGGDDHFGDARGLGELPCQGVFAAAGADDEDLHVSA